MTKCIHELRSSASIEMTERDGQRALEILNEMLYISHERNTVRLSQARYKERMGAKLAEADQLFEEAAVRQRDAHRGNL